MPNTNIMDNLLAKIRKSRLVVECFLIRYIFTPSSAQNIPILDSRQAIFGEKCANYNKICCYWH
jgi:hypothetical protein